MADDKFKVDRIDVDKEGLARDIKAQMPDFYSEQVFDFPDEDVFTQDSPRKGVEYVDSSHETPVVSGGADTESYEPSEDYSYQSESYEKEEKKGEEEQSETVEESSSEPVPVEQHPVEGQPVEGQPVESGTHPVAAPVEGQQPVNGNRPSMVDPRKAKDKPTAGGGKPAAGEKPNVGGGDAKSNALNAAANALNNKKGKSDLEDEKPQEEKSAMDEAQEKKKREEENNANTINNAADVAIASKNPYAMAAGGAIKAADKITGGKSTQMLAKAMRKANKVSPGGRSIQNASNKLAESGMGDKIGTAASMKSGGAGGAGAADKASKAAETGDKAKKASEAGDKAKKAKESGDKAKQAGDQTKKSGGSGGKGGSGNTSGSDGQGNKFDDFMRDAVKHFFMRHPLAIIVLGVILLLFLLLLVGDDFKGGNTGGGQFCSYELSGVSGTGTVKLDNLQVELINCDGTASNYTVLETIDFEKYVVGVALAEVSWRKDAPEYFKAAIVAARGFSLKRNSGMCPSNPDGCFYGYNAETGKIRMRACTNDQVYCDIDKPCYHVTRSGKPTIYGPEAEGMSGATVWKGQLDEGTKAEILAAAAEVKGKVLVDDQGNVVNTNYVNTDQQHWYQLATEGKNYEQILVEHYSSQNAKGMNSATCSNYGSIDYGNYELSSEGDTILNERLDKFLEKKGTSLEAFNNLIKSNVEKNGYGTRAGVVAAGVTLIAELGNNYNVKVPYFLSGGHHDGVRTGALGYWGSGYEDDGRRCIYTGYGNVYTVCGLDCSGFVPWAIKNGGFQMGVRLAGDFHTLDGARKVSLSSSSAVLAPGDLLESSGHIVLVVGVDENTKQYVCAEASGKEAGVLFTRRPFSGGSGYWGVKMDGYYDKYSLKGK